MIEPSGVQLRKSIRDALVLAGLRTFFYVAMYLAAVLLTQQGIAALLRTLFVFEWWMVGSLTSRFPWLTGGSVDAAHTLIALAVFLDTFSVILVLSVLLRGVSNRLQLTEK